MGDSVKIHGAYTTIDGNHHTQKAVHCLLLASFSHPFQFTVAAEKHLPANRVSIFGAVGSLHVGIQG
ncbi:hypothetical protein KY290_022094 [Solanum tuberosum]|uniref:Uncharacterized protein n=1 Tax=Solanum tuberosum TaxID=4113 RepID=A0ABQ7V5C5_SOLTU|nr:hypothetical protein KY289_021228 [Solanum tuberosum]KAH0758601.1 hypothetical protein KY290_022094 [Solanum tuberosum]